MPNNTKIQFWLQISPAYVIENFDKLITYLKQYSYDNYNISNNADYISTLDVMLEMSYRYSAAILNSPHKLPVLDESYETVIRLLAATILGADKMNRPANDLIIPLINLEIMLSSQISEKEYEAFSNIISHVAMGSRIKSFGFSLFRLDKNNFSVDILRNLLLQMTFEPIEPVSGLHAVEKNGVLIFKANQTPVIFPGNLENYSKQEKSMFIEIPQLIRFMTPAKGDYRANSFDSIIRSSKSISRLQDAIKPAPVHLREYNQSDEFIVKVISKRNYSVIAETVSHKHKKLTGKVNCQPGVTVAYKRNLFLELINVGDYIRVNLDPSEEFAFSTANTFENYYRDKLLSYPLTRKYAVFEKEISKYLVFVTLDGIRINLYNENRDKYNDLQSEALKAAIDYNLPIKIYVNEPYNAVNDKRNVLYGNVDFNGARMESEEDEDFFSLDDANNNLFLDFLSDSEEDAAHLNNYAPFDTIPVDRLTISPYIAILYKLMQDGFDDSVIRIQNAVVGVALSKIMDSEECVKLFEAEIQAASVMVQFARGEELGSFSAAPPIADLEYFRKQSGLIDSLREYKKDSNRIPEKDNQQKVRKLIEASNSLEGILDRQELHSIKSIITRILGVEDELKGLSDNRSFYGVENDILEFKSSIVFPPANHRRIQSAIADPMVQKWAIIRTVCGFLNSRSGGDLLLGIKDSGYAAGLGDDIRELYKRQLIPFMSTDAYRTYVQNIIDQSFAIEHSSDVPSASITRQTISYDIEQSQEDVEFLRIKVAPYRNGVVMIKKAKDRPACIEDIYVRLSGRTVPVDKEMRSVLLKNKKV